MVLLQFVTFALGLIALGLAMRFFCFFALSRHHLSKTMQFLLTEQVITSLGTMLFSANSLWGTMQGLPEAEWNSIPPAAAIAIRVAMFGAMIHSTHRLSISIQKIVRSEETEQ